MIVGDGKLNQPLTDAAIRTILLQKTDFTLSNTDFDVCFHHQRQLRISRKGQQLLGVKRELLSNFTVFACAALTRFCRFVFD
jgi:hypothetical protein